MLILTQTLVKVCLWAWKFKFETLSFLLSLGIVGMVLVADSYERKRLDAVQELKEYKIDQAEKALIAETEWRTRERVAEDRFNERIKVLERANADLNDNVVRVSGSLESARIKYARASEAARAEYTNALSTVSSQCIERYSWMAKIADGHANDAERLRQTSPLIAEPP